jgi:kinesin family protein C2/C3
LKQAQLTFAQTVAKSLSIFEKTIVPPIEQNAKLLDDTLRKYKREMTERRKYFNLVQELRGNIRVCIRARPFNDNDAKRGEAKDNPENCLSFPDSDVICVKRPAFDKKEYEFDRVFSGDTTQEDVFKDTRQLIGSVMDGYNVCIIAYGQTGSGKTHTMEGPAVDPGVNYRALRELFNIRKKRGSDYMYEISVSMIEIYNEAVHDLLSTAENKEKDMKIRQSKDGGVFIEGLTEEEVQTEDDVIRLMLLGHKNRAVGRTDMNAHSSRSHSLLTVTVQGHNFTAGITYIGKLHLIDLAGSERVSKSGATGDRLKEAQAINKSLSALGNVLQKLQQKGQHVPFRDSKLTYLLSDSLGGNSKCMMFINISPSSMDVDETFCSLEFAAKVSRVELGQAQQNKVRAPGAPGAVPAAGGEKKAGPVPAAAGGGGAAAPADKKIASPPAAGGGAKAAPGAGAGDGKAGGAPPAGLARSKSPEPGAKTPAKPGAPPAAGAAAGAAKKPAAASPPAAAAPAKKTLDCQNMPFFVV